MEIHNGPVLIFNTYYLVLGGYIVILSPVIFEFGTITFFLSSV